MKFYSFLLAILTAALATPAFAAEEEIIGYIISRDYIHYLADEDMEGHHSYNVVPVYEEPGDVITVNPYLDFNSEDFSLTFTSGLYARPNVQARIVAEYGIGLSAEGPHIELEDWKRCDSEAVLMKSTRQTHSFNRNIGDIQPCLIDFTKEELLNGVEQHLKPYGTYDTSRWSEQVQACYEDRDGCLKILSYKIEFFTEDQRIKEAVDALRPIRIIVPNGC